MATHFSESPSSIADSSIAPAGRWLEGLTPAMSLAEALAGAFQQRWQALLHHLPLAAESPEDEEAHVHKLRVASRRLSAVIDAATECLPDVPCTRLARAADRVRRDCGKARNLDVQRRFLETQLTSASLEDAAAIELLCERAELRRAQLQKKLRRRLPRRERALRREGDQVFTALQALSGTALGAAPSYEEAGARSLRRKFDAVWSRAASGVDSEAALHKLRIACKRLRYASEVFLPILHESFREEFYPQLERVQDLLGDVHDLAEARRALKKKTRKWKRLGRSGRWNRSSLAGFRRSELVAGAEAVRRACTDQAERARSEFLRLWPSFSGASFREPMDDMLKRLESKATPAGDRCPAPAAAREGGS